jgi:uncharacterized membrane protein YheB (UPF0754 family)
LLAFGRRTRHRQNQKPIENVQIIIMALAYAWWNYFLIPWVAGFVGYFTNVVALQMTFYPLEYRGILLFRFPSEPWGLFGWQGIIPTRAEKMASICFEIMTTRLFNIKEIFSRLDPTQFAVVMSDPVLLMMDTIIDEVANTYMPTIWQKLPSNVRDDVVVTADQEATSFLTEFMKDMQMHVDDVVDIKHMTVTKCVENKDLIVKVMKKNDKVVCFFCFSSFRSVLNHRFASVCFPSTPIGLITKQIFQECGEKEFVFIRQSGFYFGFIFGIFQMILWCVL